MVNLQNIGNYILVQTPVYPVDVALVFGTQHSNDLFASHIYGLWRAGVFKKVVLTGGVPVEGGASEAATLALLLSGLGLPDTDMRLEESSTNTGENVQLSLPVLQALAGEGFSLHTILGIGKIFAARRCLMTLHTFLPESRLLFSGINTFGVATENWQDCLPLRDRILGEYDKIRRYVTAGLIVDDPSLPREKNQ